MEIKNILLFITVLIIVGGGAFYGGMRYEQSKKFFPQDFQNFSPEQRQQFFLQREGQRVDGRFLVGKVIGKDEKSLTLKMQDNSTRIVFFSDSTKISKTTEGKIDDIEIGKQIIVSGSQNSDGSYSAKTIQVSPILSNSIRP